LCLHEEHAVALAHGYAKVTERPLAVALHSNVGLMHATMALYNAFCDRVPMLVIGATGPLDAALRRPWIDWIHTSADQGALIRSYVKWDDQPASVPAALEALVRADMITRSYPCAPVYVCLDAALQEQKLGRRPPRLPDVSRHRPPAAPAGDAAAIAAAAAVIRAAQRPALLIGRVSREQSDWDNRVRLAERLGAVVLTDLKVGAAFPSDHRCHPVAPATFLPAPAAELLRAADAVLALDWVDLGGTLASAYGNTPPPARIISVSADAALHNGWSKDHFSLAATDLAISAHPDRFVAELLAELPDEGLRDRRSWPPPRPRRPRRAAAGRGITVSALAAALGAALAGSSSCLIRAPLGWSGEDWPLTGPLDYLGQDGGAGLGSGPGMAVGAALALAGSGRVPLAVLGDGDFLMGATALWTAARYRLALLVVVANNHTFLNDEIHQERVARTRSRPVENRWVGQRIGDPDPDLAALARSLGLRGFGPVTRRSELAPALDQALAAVAAGEAAVIDVAVLPGDYPGAATASGQNRPTARAAGTSRQRQGE
jgi:thiamine pyrophosphate-dependent acetolactate synthase large subunit-like protein